MFIAQNLVSSLDLGNLKNFLNLFILKNGTPKKRLDNIHYSKNKKEMSQIQKKDNYNLAQKSRSGQVGFDTFKGDDGQFYFHFNDTNGLPLLFSEGYKTATKRDNGQQSVINNAAHLHRFHHLKDAKGKPFFVLKAGNSQEIARSRAFASDDELVEQLAFFKDKVTAETATTDKAIPTQDATVATKTVAETAAVDTVNALQDAHKTATNTATSKQTVVETTAVDTANAAQKAFVKTSPVVTTTKTASTQVVGFQAVAKENVSSEKAVEADFTEGSLEATEPLRQSFRIDFYQAAKDKLPQGKITYLLDGETRTFSGFDVLVMSAFVNSKMPMPMVLKTDKPMSKPITKTEAMPEMMVLEATPKQAASTEAASVPMESGSVLTTSKLGHGNKPNLTVTNKIDQSGAVRENQPFEMRLFPGNDESHHVHAGVPCHAQVYVYDFGTRERLLLLERNVALSKHDRSVAVRVHPFALPRGSYRLTLIATTRHNDGSQTNINKWNGSALVQVF